MCFIMTYDYIRRIALLPHTFYWLLENICFPQPFLLDAFFHRFQQTLLFKCGRGQCESKHENACGSSGARPEKYETMKTKQKSENQNHSA